MPEDSLVTIETYDNYINAHLDKTRLESEGLKIFLFDENIVSLNPLYSNSIGGIKLKTLVADATRASEILKNINAIPYTNDDDKPIRCPRCQSTSVFNGFNSARSLRSYLVILISFFTVTYPILLERKYRCKICNHEFELDKKPPILAK